MEKFDAIESAMCKELDAIGRKLDGGNEMSASDLEKIDMLAHALKSLATFKAMKEAEEYEGGYSGRPMRGGNRSYSDGYSQGFYDAQGGHYPYMPRGGRGW